MADDNDGAVFDAGTDSLHEIRSDMALESTLAGLIVDNELIKKIEEGDWELFAPDNLYFYEKGTRTAPGVGTRGAKFNCYDIDGNSTVDDIARVINVT
jgi:hypothetical protein